MLGTLFGSQLIFSHLAFLASHVLAHLGAAWSFVAAWESAVLLREASLCASTHILLSGWVIELLLLAWQGIVLAHVHRLWGVSHLAVLLLVARKLVWVYHREHLGEALADASNSLLWVTEGKFVPRHELNSLSVHID